MQGAEGTLQRKSTADNERNKIGRRNNDDDGDGKSKISTTDGEDGSRRVSGADKTALRKSIADNERSEIGQRNNDDDDRVGK
ncbi:unnamed protein product [Linum trigynum]|uniref:Uncharacterized protein n=1 Tax=Linum trigynum TaxID=586398 RepID=A0AAV2E871_9ROSI